MAEYLAVAKDLMDKRFQIFPPRMAPAAAKAGAAPPKAPPAKAGAAPAAVAPPLVLPVGPGPYTTYSASGLAKRLETGDIAKGYAVNLFQIDLSKTALGCPPLVQFEVEEYALKTKVEDRMFLEHPIHVVVSTKDKAELEAGAPWSRLGGDSQVYGLLWKYHNWRKLAVPAGPGATEVKLAKSTAMTQLENTMSHVPVTIHYMATDGDFQEKAFVQAFQIKEDFRRAEEAQAPGGWEVMLSFAHTRAMLQTRGTITAAAEDEMAGEALLKIFSQVQYAETSDYKLKGKAEDSKTSTSILRAHDRFVSEGMDTLLRKARLALPRRGPFDQVSGWAS